MARKKPGWASAEPARGLEAAMRGIGTPTVLVVDDNQEHSRALGKIFERAGYRVCTAGHGQEALKLLMDQPFDLVLTDLRMPRVNGLALLRNIRDMSPQAAVVIITAFGEWVTYMDAMECGASDYLSKPARREDILLAARKALARRGIRAPRGFPVPSGEAGGAAA
jgi:DNA-binding NtrC family response regulator